MGVGNREPCRANGSRRFAGSLASRNPDREHRDRDRPTNAAEVAPKRPGSSGFGCRAHPCRRSPWSVTLSIRLDLPLTHGSAAVSSQRPTGRTFVAGKPRPDQAASDSVPWGGGAG